MHAYPNRTKRLTRLPDVRSGVAYGNPGQRSPCVGASYCSVCAHYALLFNITARRTAGWAGRVYARRMSPSSSSACLDDFKNAIHEFTLGWGRGRHSEIGTRLKPDDDDDAIRKVSGKNRENRLVWRCATNVPSALLPRDHVGVRARPPPGEKSTNVTSDDLPAGLEERRGFLSLSTVISAGSRADEKVGRPRASDSKTRRQTARRQTGPRNRSGLGPRRPFFTSCRTVSLVVGGGPYFARVQTGPGPAASGRLPATGGPRKKIYGAGTRRGSFTTSPTSSRRTRRKRRPVFVRERRPDARRARVTRARLLYRRRKRD